jgi:hypothetical protein
MTLERRASATPANLAAVAAGFAVLAIVVLGAVAALILATRDSVVSKPLPVAGTARPREDYRQIREEQSNILREYQWIDRNKGTARIPIERAMALILDRGSLKPSRVDSSH